MTALPPQGKDGSSGATGTPTNHAGTGGPARVDGGEPFAALGEPFATFGRAVLAADDARRREHAATVAGDIDARERARFDLEEAVTAAYAVRYDEAARFLFGLRCCIELFPGAVESRLGIPDMLERVEDLEAVVAAGRAA